MTNQYANTMAYMALVHFLVEIKGYSKGDAIIKAKEQLQKEIKG